jgi:hypothetical protein
MIGSVTLGIAARIQHWEANQWLYNATRALPVPEEVLTAFWNGIQHHNGVKTVVWSLQTHTRHNDICKRANCGLQHTTLRVTPPPQNQPRGLV